MNSSYERLVEIVKKLRSPEGCPWDREQNLYSIKEHFLEEAYELLEALDNEDIEHVREELGDVAFHVVFHGVMAEEEGKFSLEEALDLVSEKLVRRHPHVFGDAAVNNSEEVVESWEKIKAEEKKNSRKSVLDGVPATLPTLPTARKLQEKARKVGFDWDSKAQCMDKVNEEFGEFTEAVLNGSREEIEHELGDILFALVNISRFLDVDSDEALRKCNSRFVSRFDYIGKRLKEKGMAYEEASLEEMEELWQEAKKTEAG
ncbi:nucleoside triphosphate pyrophosphohydrolase [Limisalsivibrio acetivorans]|uniref:nucleoside triphosphate pyrophosphohydrolase n=1 Tax=Limisalsivibrio acetivorans TaxID=1304888 RepID=UPI0003B4A4C7|nr:nucleoside triphosphate pyrophosphohydrolase [Limisalsivibrio acetivorans]